MPLTSTDWAVIIGYLLVNLAIGVYYRRRASGNTEEFLAQTLAALALSVRNPSACNPDRGAVSR